MLYELIGDGLTDFIAPLEERCEEADVFRRFAGDLRVKCALDALLEHGYNLEPSLENLCDRLSFLDDVWVSTYLMGATGNARGAEGIRRDCLRFFDPFTSYNPITRNFAYCEYIENSTNSHDLSEVIDSMDHYLGHCRDDVTKRMYPALKKISERKLEYLERKEEFQGDLSFELKENPPSDNYAD